MSAQGWRDGGWRRTFTGFVVLGLSLSLFSFCGSRGPSEGRTVAWVNDRRITLEELEQQLGEASQQDASLRVTQAGKRELLDRLVQKELLIQEARRQGLDRKEAFVRAIERYWEQTLIKGLLQQVTQELEQKFYVTEEEIAGRHRAALSRGEKLGPLEEARGELERALREEKKAAALQQWLADLKRQARIEVREIP